MGGVLPVWEKDACISCGLCVSICPVNAIEEKDSAFILDKEKCIYCGLCIKNCSTSAWTAQKTGYTLFLGGTLGKKPRLGTRAKVLIETKEELLHDIERAFNYYLANGQKKERFGHTLDRIGVDKAFAEIFMDTETIQGGTDALQDVAPSNEAVLDLLGVCCPMNFVRAKIAIENRIRRTPRILLADGKPIVNVTRSLKDEDRRC
jgi:ferredoxin